MRAVSSQNSVLRHYRYFYFRLFKYIEGQRNGTPVPWIVAGYLLSLLTFLQILFADTIMLAVFGNSPLVGGSKEHTAIGCLIVGLVLFVIVHVLFIRNGRWQAIMREFGNMSASDEHRINLVFKIFVAGSMALFPIGLLVAGLHGAGLFP